MESIKTYNTVNSTNESVHFKITQMGNMYETRIGKPDVPHRHNFYTVILVNKAKGKHFVDFKEFSLGNKQVFFIHPGQVHQVIEKNKPSGYVMLFSEQFLIQNHIPLSFIGDVNLFHDYGNIPPLPLSQEKFKTLSGYCEEIIAHNIHDKFAEQVYASYLKLFLIQCNTACPEKQENPQNIEAGYSLLKRMKALLEKHYKEWHFSSQYAETLHITPDHLNRTIKSLTGKTAKEYIHARICTSAKRLIYFSDLSTKEIGYELGFNEPANFSAFFKKCTGVSPSEFKKTRAIS